MTRALLLLAFLAPTAGAQSEGAPAASSPALWSVSDDDSTVYLLGSVHFLSAEAYPLSGAVEAAYADAEVVALELDIAEAAAAASDVSGLAAVGLYTDGSALADHVPPEVYAATTEAAADLGFPPGAIDPLRPWFIALVFSGIAAERAGYEAALGLDHHFFARAGADAKERIALETFRGQLDVFAGLSPEGQVDLLSKTLDDLQHAEAALAGLQALWRTGDVEALAAELNTTLSPELAVRLLTDRNRAWVPQIEALLARTGEDALVVVGAGHLVGAGSVVALLEDAGYLVVRR